MGISVGVLVDIDETRAAVGDGATITALGNGVSGVDVRDGVFDGDGNQGPESVRGLAVTATSFEDVTLLAIAASGSLGIDNSGEEDEEHESSTNVGIAASVGVAVMHGQTKATLGEGMCLFSSEPLSAIARTTYLHNNSRNPHERYSSSLHGSILLI